MRKKKQYPEKDTQKAERNNISLKSTLMERCQRKHQERCILETIQNKVTTTEQEHIARRRKQAEVKKEMEAGRTYYEEMKPTLAELRLILKQGENRINTVESHVGSVSR